MSSNNIIGNLPVDISQQKIPKLTGKEDAALRKAAQQFEAVFTNIVYQKMREMVPDSGVLGDSHEEKFFQSMLYEQYSSMGAKNQPNGIADMIYRQLSKTLATAPAPESQGGEKS